MISRSGCFIVLEGTDGSGKGTQFKKLIERLNNEGYEVAQFDFPRYDKPSSHFVKEYLNGNYGTVEEVGPYTASLFYALDRYEAAPHIKEALDAGKVVIANRYTGSNMGHQGTKFDHVEERKGYFLWLDSIEFQMLGIPRPDLSVVLRVPAETAQSLIDNKEARDYTEKKRDLHEADLDHLKKSVEVYDNLCQLFPKDFKQLDCVRNHKLLDIDTVHTLIWETIAPILPKPAKKRVSKAKAADKSKTSTDLGFQTKYYIPEVLDEDSRDKYVEIMKQIMHIHASLNKDFVKFFDSNSYASAHNDYGVQANGLIDQVLASVLPLASDSKNVEKFKDENNLLKEMAKSQLHETYSIDYKPVTLASASPRNELQLIPNIVYEHSGLSLRQIQQEVDEWSFDQKLNAYTAYLETGTEALNILKNLQYSWDIVSDYSTMIKVQDLYEKGTITYQTLSPRYGYDVPQIIEDAGLTDIYEQCFDLSLKLYSTLQAAGLEDVGQLTVLNGHRLRWKWDINGLELVAIYKNLSTKLSDARVESLLKEMLELIAETHPVFAEHLRSKITGQ